MIDIESILIFKKVAITNGNILKDKMVFAH